MKRVGFDLFKKRHFPKGDLEPNKLREQLRNNYKAE